jgi:hypothetical protein
LWKCGGQSAPSDAVKPITHLFASLEELVKARTDDGRKRAKGRGVRFGRRQEALQRLANGETLVDVARTYGVDPTTIGRLQSPFVPGSVAA